jgi:hypothetical protein
LRPGIGRERGKDMEVGRRGRRRPAGHGDGGGGVGLGGGGWEGGNLGC